MTVGGGCFWCIEAIFNEIKGVEKVICGYAGGNVPGTPTYKEVCSGLTGHAEVVQVSFNVNLISYEELLSIFMLNHDPTTSNVKDSNYGSQYRSVIFYHDEFQKEISEPLVLQLSSEFENPLTTEITALAKFHPAEDNHQKYYTNNPEAAYCKGIITPKLTKLRNEYSDKLKKERNSLANAS